MDNVFFLFKRYYHLHQADMDLNTLKNEGFEAFITDKMMGSFSFLAAATDGVNFLSSKKI